MLAILFAILDFLFNKQMHALVLILRCFCGKKKENNLCYG